MSDTISLEFIGYRLDAVQNDVHDLRRSFVSFRESSRDALSGLRDEMTSLGKRMSSLEQRMDAMVDRQSRFEETQARLLLLVRRIALKVGVDQDDV